MRPRERHPATGASAPPDTLRLRSVLSSWPEAGKPFGDTLTAPRWPWPGVSPGPPPACRPHTGPQRGGLRCGPSPLCFYSLSHSHPSPTPAQAHQTAAVLQKPWSEADKHPGQHRVRDSGAPFLKPPQWRLSPQLCPPRKVTVSVSPSHSLSTSQPLSLCPFHIVSAGADLGRQKTFPAISWGRAATPRSSEPLPPLLLHRSRRPQEQKSAGLSVGLTVLMRNSAAASGVLSF